MLLLTSPAAKQRQDFARGAASLFDLLNARGT
jgi:hypothetical protein